MASFMQASMSIPQGRRVWPPNAQLALKCSPWNCFSVSLRNRSLVAPFPRRADGDEFPRFFLVDAQSSSDNGSERRRDLRQQMSSFSSEWLYTCNEFHHIGKFSRVIFRGFIVSKAYLLVTSNSSRVIRTWVGHDSSWRVAFKNHLKELGYTG
jgi:hypothetical protein